jgi:branched-chain amino acid transport system substrate-binding protein
MSSRKTLTRLVAAAFSASLFVGACGGGGGGEIKIGGLATLEGPFAVPGQDSFRGMELALNKYAGPKAADGTWTIAGKKITLIKEGSDATPDVALAKAKKLIEQDNVDILIGPLSGDEGLLAIKPYAKQNPTKTFINGSSAAQDTTFRDPAPNFFRFSTDGAQWQAGLGTYAFDVKGYKKMALVAEDYSFPYTQVGGFMYEFCAKGGHMVQKFWVPLGTKDYSAVVSGIPSDIDALYVALGGADAINFLSQYQAAGGTAPMVGGSITVDQTVLGAQAKIPVDYLVGTPSAGPIADNDPEQAWIDFVKDYQTTFKDDTTALPSPSLFAHAYYIETAAALLALKQVNGDLSNGEKAFMDALAKTTFDTPTGKVSLDANRAGIADEFVTEVAKNADGSLYNKVVSVAKQVDQTLNLGRDNALFAQPVSRDFPACP